MSCVDELERSREPGEPAADDGDSHDRRLAATIRSFVSGESRGGPSKTSKPFCLDPLEGRPVEAGERRHAGGAAPVEMVEEQEAVREVVAGARGLVGHQRLPGRASAGPRAMSSSETPNEASSPCGR